MIELHNEQQTLAGKQIVPVSYLEDDGGTGNGFGAVWAIPSRLPVIAATHRLSIFLLRAVRAAIQAAV